MTTKHVVWITRVLGAFALFVLSGGSTEAGTLAATWDPNTEPDIAGYVLYYGTAPGVYTNNIDVGNQTSWVLTGLVDGRQYFLSVRAYNLSRVQGAPSDEVSGTTTAAIVPCTYALSASNQSVPATGGNGTFNVTAAPGCSWTATSSASWLSVNAGASGSGNGTVSYSAVTNAGAQRSATITVGGVGLTVTEAAAASTVPACQYSVNPTTASVPSGGGPGILNLAAGPGCAWTAVSSAGWITVTAGASGSGDGTVNYSVLANTGTVRTGTITVAGKPLTVTEAAPASPPAPATTCTFSVSPLSASVSASGGNGGLTITANAGCAWTVKSNVSWITVTAGASGSGNGSVSYSTAANSGTQRTGTMTAGGQTVTITEAAAPVAAPAVCTGSLDQTQVSFPAQGGQGRLRLTIASGCRWVAERSHLWIEFVGHDSGSGNAEVVYTVAPSRRSRTGTIWLGGRTVSINQAGLGSSGRSVTDGVSEVTDEATFVYTNNNINGPNTVSAFAVDPTGALTPVAGSPFATGGIGRGYGRPGANGLTVDPAGRFLFVGNAVSSDISVFLIDSETGNIGLIQGGPFTVPGPAHGDGLSFAITPNGKLLMVGNTASKEITVFSVGDDGRLTRTSNIALPLGGAPGGMKVSADGAFLAVALDTAGPVAVFTIAFDGRLASVPGSPFFGAGVNATSVDMSCVGNLLFAANGAISNRTATTTVDVFSLARSGSLSLVPGSPFEPGVGVNSSVALLSPDARFLFSSNQGLRNDGGDTVTVASVRPDGSLSLVPGSPFSIRSGDVPMGMATNETGTLLFTANAPGTGSADASIGVFRVASDGSLSSVAGGPFAVPGSNLSSIAAVPAAVCKDATR